MKRIAIIITALAILFFVAGCKSSDSIDNNISGENLSQTLTDESEVTVWLSSEVSHNFKWTKIDDKNGIIVLERIAGSLYSEDLQENDDIDITEIYTYFVTFSEKDGTYSVEGKLSSLGLVIDGASNEEFLKNAVSNTGDSRYNDIRKRLYNGEIINKIDEIENYTQRADEVFSAKFTLNDGKINLSEYAVEYTEVNTKHKIKKMTTTTVGNDNIVQISKETVYANGILETCIEYAGYKTHFENTDVAKTITRYTDGELSAVEKYNFTEQKIYYEYYYSAFDNAVADINSATIGKNADAKKVSAAAGVCTDVSGDTNVILLADTIEDTKIILRKNMIINLNDHKITFNSIGFDTVKENGNNIVIKNGEISCTNDKKAIAAILLRGGNSLTVNNVSIHVNTSLKSAYGITTTKTTDDKFTVLKVENCKITTASINSNSYGICVLSGVKSTVSDSVIKAHSNYSGYTADQGYVQSSVGVYISCGSTVVLNDCYVYGVHSGVSADGDLTINGGTYEGYGHGGIYFSGTDITYYVRNATISDSGPMVEGFESYVTGETSTIYPGNNAAGFYVGGSSGRDNITIFIDNCNIHGAKWPFVLRGTETEQNNKIYISNSKINKDYSSFPNAYKPGIRIDNDTNRLYIGKGCNFDISDTNNYGGTFDLTNVVFATDEIYCQ